MAITNIDKGTISFPIIHDLNYLINNFTETKKETDWFFGTHTLSADGTVILTGVNQTIASSTFTVNPTDIICFEFTVSLPTPSTSSGGAGIYLGSKNGQKVKRYYYNYSSKIWGLSSNEDTNPYFLYAYNSSIPLTMKTYILGSSVDINTVPGAECTNNESTYCVQLPAGTTSTNIRTGYNTNTSMVIHFKNPKIYYYTNRPKIEKVKIGEDYLNAEGFIED